MENTDTLPKPSKLELLKALIDKIKGFSPKETVEVMEKKLNGMSKTKRGLLGLSLILIGGSLTFYSLNNAAYTTKAYWQELKVSKASKTSRLQSNKIFSDRANTNGASATNGTISTNAAGESVRVEWQPINYMLASTPARRAKALESVGFPQSEGVIVALSLTCPECIKLAVDMNSHLPKDKLPSIVGVAVAPGAEIQAWKEKLNLDYEVKSISETDMENLGVALFPTLIKVSNTSKNQQKPKYEITASSDDGKVLITQISQLNSPINANNSNNSK
jgi:hypothetical protein